jgi:hypothetical protein
MEPSEERIRENNDLFREANERIRATSGEYDDPVDPIPFLCECPEERCSTIVRLTPAEYADIRADADHYFTTTGHEVNERHVAEVVSMHNGYVIVRKASDPR